MDGFPALTEPKAIVFSPDGRMCYVAGGSTGALVSFCVDPDSGELSSVQVVPKSPEIPIGGARALSFSQDGGVLFVAARDDDAVVAFSVDGNGMLAPLGAARNGACGTSMLDGPQGLAVSPGGTVFVSAGTSDAVLALAFDRASGLFSAVSTVSRDSGSFALLDNPGHLAYDPSSGELFVAAVTGDAVFRLSVGGQGELGFLQVVRDADSGGGAVLNEPVGLALANGCLYVASYYGNAILRYGRDASGTLSYLDRARDGETGISNLKYPKSLSFSSDGRVCFAAAYGSNALAAFTADVSGTMIPSGAFGKTAFPDLGVGQAQACAVSPSGTFAVSASRADETLCLFVAR